jgi:hypothetical protein
VRRLVMVLLLVLAFPSSATGGGWWSFIQTDRSTVAVGQRITAKADVLFGSIAAAREAEEHGRFYVYALRGFDYSVVTRAMTKASPGDWWSLGDAEPVELAPVVVQFSEGNLGRARAAFVVPDLPPATYALMFCDAGCAHPLADVVPTRSFTVVADRATAELAVRTTRLEERLRLQARSLARARAVGRRARAAVTRTDSELRALEAQVRGLRREAAEDVPSSPLSRWPLAGWVVAGVLAGALAFILLRRRSTKASPHSPAAWQPSEEELAALTAAERSRPPREHARTARSDER